LAARVADRELAAFERGEFLAHWTYSEQEWRSFHDAERRRANTVLLWASVSLVAVALVLVAVGLFTPTDRGAWLAAAGAVGLTAALVAALLGGANAAGHRRSFTSTREAFVGRESAFINGTHHRWTALGTTLDTVELLPAGPAGQPAAIQFNLLLQSRHGRGSQSVRVPVPAGREDEARQVLAHFRR
jgi:hypothetical protein